MLKSIAEMHNRGVQRSIIAVVRWPSTTSPTTGGGDWSAKPPTKRPDLAGGGRSNLLLTRVTDDVTVYQLVTFSSYSS